MVHFDYTLAYTLKIYASNQFIDTTNGKDDNQEAVTHHKPDMKIDLFWKYHHVAFTR